MKRAFVIACLVMFVGCGGDSKPPVVGGTGNGGGGNKRDSGSSEETDASIEDAGMGNGPELQFSMPAVAKDSNDDNVITEQQVTARCQAKVGPTGSKLIPDTVAITLESDPDDSTKRLSPATTAVTNTNGDYEAKFDVSDFPNGKLHFHCAAADMAGHTSAITLTTLLDLGPKIEVSAPMDKGNYALRTPMVIKFKVTTAPLADADDKAAVDEVKLLVSGAETVLTEDEDAPGSYQTTVDFNDKSLFMVPPSSAEILISASDKRTPKPAVRSIKYVVNVDGDGPSITVDSPPALSIVHGEVTLKVTVTDASGVEPKTLRAVSRNLLEINDWVVMGNVYQATFDTRQFGNGTDITEITINLSASDQVGNETGVETVSHRLRLDNVPPVISLDPPLVRERHIVNEHSYCSAAFDPVGTDARGDRTTALASSIYRAIVMDDTNKSAGASAYYLAGVARDKVNLYAQVNPSVPLLIDTDGDHYCDEINTAGLTREQEPVVLQMSAVNPRGASWFGKNVTFDEPLHDVGSAYACEADPDGLDNPPINVCGESGPRYLTRVVRGQSEDKPPAIYAISPTNGSIGADCAGGSWQLALSVKEGWRCLAARAEDTIGNIGVSAPIHVCFDAQDGTPACNSETDTPPDNCTDGCVMRSSQLYAPNQVLND